MILYRGVFAWEEWPFNCINNLFNKKKYDSKVPGHFLTVSSMMKEEFIIDNNLLLQIDSWKKIIDVLELENTEQKNNLAGTLKKQQEGNGTELDTWEYYQNLFIQQDQAFSLMRHDISGFENLVKAYRANTNESRKKLIPPFEKLNSDIRVLEKKFYKLKADFKLDNSTVISKSKA